MSSSLEELGVEGLDRGGRSDDVPRGDGRLETFHPVRGYLRLTEATLQERNAHRLHLAVLGHQAGSAQQTEDGPAHVLTGQRVDDGVEERVDHGHAQEVVGLEEQAAGAGGAEEVEQQEEEEREPAGDEDAEDDGDRLEEGQVLLRLPRKAFPQAARARSLALGVGADDAEDAHVQDTMASRMRLNTVTQTRM